MSAVHHLLHVTKTVLTLWVALSAPAMMDIYWLVMEDLVMVC